MPLGRQLSKLFNPGPAEVLRPEMRANREALFAQLALFRGSPDE